MKDRVSKYPGRVIITPTGKANEYDIVRADEPVEPGMPLCKETLLPDAVCDNLGLDRASSEPKDAFNTLAMRPAPPGAYNSDLFLYLSGKHPALNADSVVYGGYDPCRAELQNVVITGGSSKVGYDYRIAAHGMAKAVLLARTSAAQYIVLRGMATAPSISNINFQWDKITFHMVENTSFLGALVIY